MNSKPHYTFADKLCMVLDQAVRALFGHPKTTGEIYPAATCADGDLTDQERRHAAGLMRINHAGEVCAQALYHGQGMVSRDTAVTAKMQQAAIEEGDHLLWCKTRLDELGSHTSYLNPLWYLGSFCIGMAAGMIGDKWSLGFVAETESQVIKHLSGHLDILPDADQRSYAILHQMNQDEYKHRQDAIAAGAHELPDMIRRAMALTSKIMVKTAYWI